MADTKTSVVIKYSKPGAAPPIYLAGSFPDSVWQPQEMEYTNDSKDHYVFSKAVEVEEGKEYQYKFRIGDGDWWMSDEDAPIVTDDIGNRNNLLKVPIHPSPEVKPVSNENSPEENSTPRTIPDADTKEEKMETPIESTPHIGSGDKNSESSHPRVSTVATDSISDHGAETNSEEAEQKHGPSPLAAEASHAAEPEKKSSTKELDLSNIPVQELEVSSSVIDEPAPLDSHAHQKADGGLKTTTKVPDSKPAVATEETSETSEKGFSNSTDIVEPEEVSTKESNGVLHPVTSADKNGVVEQLDLVPIALEKSNLEEESPIIETEIEEDIGSKNDDVSKHPGKSISPIDLKQPPVGEGAKKTETVTNKDESLNHHAEPAAINTEAPDSKQEPHTGKTNEEPVTTSTEEPKLYQQPVVDECGAQEETSEMKAEALEHKESTSVAHEEQNLIQEPDFSESETKEPDIAHIKESASIQGPQASEGEDETKEEPNLTRIKEPTSAHEPLTGDDKLKEKPDLADGHATVDDKLAGGLETNKSQDSELLTSGTTLAHQGTRNLKEEANKEVSESTEDATSNSVLPNDATGSKAEETSSLEHVVVEEIDATPTEEQATYEPLEVEQPIEIATSKDENTAPEDDSSKWIDVHEPLTSKTSEDKLIEGPEPKHELGSSIEESLGQEIVGGNETGESSGDATNTLKNDEQTNPLAEAASMPILKVEKVDSEPRHGDDFGSDATYAQKCAHNSHAQDTVPDQVTIRQQTATPDLANVAAEVADSAALLDETPPSPPMSDKEAGKIGYRRLSHTPIPEVAETAAEVADAAALIDENPKPTSIDLPNPQRELLARRLDGLDRDLDVETPFDERAPLFAHECNGPPTAEERLKYESAQGRTAAPEPLFREFDPNDPSLEPFPSNFNQILEHVRRLENQLSENQTDVERNATSPVTMNGNLCAEGVDLPTPSPRSLAQESSPSLLPIVEEHIESESGPRLTVLPLSMDKSQSDGNTSPEPIQEPGERETRPIEQEETSNSDLSSQPSVVQFMKGPNKLRPILPDLPQTPFVENKALNLGASPQNSSQNSPTELNKNSPTITVQPATPAASLNAKIIEPIPKENAAKTTSFAEQDNDSSLRARKQPANVPERSITPASMRSAGNDANDRNFLRAFFHVVFVDWIGGLFRKLCGGGRHTLLAVPAVLIVISAPILYLSGPANFGFGFTS